MSLPQKQIGLRASPIIEDEGTELTASPKFEVNILKCISAALHQNLYPPELIPEVPRAVKFLKVKPIRQVQDLARDEFHPSSQAEFKRTSKGWRG